ncbi:hypothetical protein [Streptomyces sp. NPDC057702]|uniref:hypothetical protein n=1 Tax=unclassified Streptomyces TaxID=2593676 RepID=UPI0036AD19A0
MRPEQEAAVTGELTRAKVSLNDQQRIITQLRKSPYGANISEIIASKKFSDVEGFKQVLSDIKNKQEQQAVHMALQHAVDLERSGVPIDRMGFEKKMPDDKLDLDVFTRESGPRVDPATGKPIEPPIDYAYQLKGVEGVDGIKSAARKISRSQLYGNLPHKIAILDVHSTRAAFTSQHRADITHFSKKSNIVFHLRFQDGYITVPPRGKLFP